MQSQPFIADPCPQTHQARLWSPALEARAYASARVRLEFDTSAVRSAQGTEGADLEVLGLEALAADPCPQIDAVRLLGVRTDSRTDGGGAVDGGGAAGPRFRRAEDKARRAEERIEAERQRHTREVAALKERVSQLQQYGEAVRLELDHRTAELQFTQSQLTAAKQATSLSSAAFGLS